MIFEEAFFDNGESGKKRRAMNACMEKIPSEDVRKLMFSDGIFPKLPRPIFVFVVAWETIG